MEYGYVGETAIKGKTRKVLQGQKMRKKAVSLAGDQSQGNPLASLSFPRAGFLKDVLYSGFFFFRVLFSQLYIPTPLGHRELLLPVAQWSRLGYFRRRKLVRDLKGSQGFSFSPVQQVTIWYPQFCKYLIRKEIQLHSSEQKNL